jgi:hypothetical protein
MKPTLKLILALALFLASITGLVFVVRAAVRNAPAVASMHGPAGKSVEVRGYTRRDGSHVEPHTRRLPQK